MLKIDTTIGSDNILMSNETINTTTAPYFPFIVSMPSVTRQISSEHGGYMRAKSGQIAIREDAFKARSGYWGDNWPPPQTISINSAYWGDIFLFDGVGSLESFDNEVAVYTVYGPEYSSLESAQTYNDTLANIFSGFATSLGLTLDSSKAVATNIIYTIDSDDLTINVADKIATGANHMFYTDSTKLYLIDMLTANGTSALSDLEIEPAAYAGNDPPYAFFRGEGTAFYVRGSSDTGNTDFEVTPVHTSQSEVETQLGRAKTIIERNAVAVSAAIEILASILPGAKITYTDTAKIIDTDVELYSRSISYNFSGNEEKITIAGDCVLS
jgi:hypothetical protein